MVKAVAELVMFIARRGEEWIQEVSPVTPDLYEKFVIGNK